MAKKKCEAVNCGLTIDCNKNGYAEITPSDSIRASGLQTAIFQRDPSRLPVACQACGDKCAGGAAIVDLGPKKK